MAGPILAYRDFKKPAVKNFAATSPTTGHISVGFRNINKAESLLDANIAKSLVSCLLTLTDVWGV